MVLIQCFRQYTVVIGCYSYSPEYDDQWLQLCLLSITYCYLFVQLAISYWQVSIISLYIVTSCLDDDSSFPQLFTWISLNVTPLKCPLFSLFHCFSLLFTLCFMLYHLILVFLTYFYLIASYFVFTGLPIQIVDYITSLHSTYFTLITLYKQCIQTLPCFSSSTQHLLTYKWFQTTFLYIDSHHILY